MGGEMGLTPEKLAGLTPEKPGELRGVDAQGHAADLAGVRRVVRQGYAGGAGRSGA